MAKKPLPDTKYLRKLLEYDPASGELIWKARHPSLFVEGGRPAQTMCKIWNTRFAGKPAFAYLTTCGHRSGVIGGVRFYAQRVIWKLVTGEEPIEVDHINGDGTDNRWANLRNVTHAENQKNLALGKNNTSGATGVSFAKNMRRWCAYIQVDRRRIILGYFDHFEDARSARKKAEARFRFHPNHGMRQKPTV